MKKKKTLLITFLTCILMLVFAQAAFAYTLAGYSWSDPKAITYSYMTGTPSAYVTAIAGAANAWNNNCSKVYTAYNTSSVAKYSVLMILLPELTEGHKSRKIFLLDM